MSGRAVVVESNGSVDEEVHVQLDIVGRHLLSFPSFMLLRGRHRTTFLRALAAVLVVCGLALLWMKVFRRRPPDIILVTIDTLRADHLGVYGYDRDTSPSLDRLCESAVRFDAAVTPMPTTDPAHSTIMTALYPANHGVLNNGWVLGKEQLTIAEHLRKAGYHTQGFVSVHHLSRVNGFAQGFDGFDDDLGGDRWLTPAQVSDKAVAFVKTAKRPFFLWIHYWDPHAPYSPPAKYDRFKPKDYKGSRAAFDGSNRYPNGQFSSDDRADVDRIISLYDAEILYTDSEISRLFGALDDRGIGESSLMVITADHGEHLDEIIASHEYGFDHGEYLFAGDVRVPLIIRFPGGEYGGQSSTPLVSNMDIAPTILDYLGEDPLPGADGVSLMPLIRQGTPVRDRLFLQVRSPKSKDLPRFHEYGVRTPDWKAILEEHKGRFSLHKTGPDDGQRRDHASQQPDTVAELKESLSEWRSGLGPVRMQKVSPEQKRILRSLGYAH